MRKYCILGVAVLLLLVGAVTLNLWDIKPDPLAIEFREVEQTAQELKLDPLVVYVTHEVGARPVELSMVWGDGEQESRRETLHVPNRHAEEVVWFSNEGYSTVKVVVFLETQKPKAALLSPDRKMTRDDLLCVEVLEIKPRAVMKYRVSDEKQVATYFYATR